MAKYYIKSPPFHARYSHLAASLPGNTRYVRGVMRWGSGSAAISALGGLHAKQLSTLQGVDMVLRGFDLLDIKVRRAAHRGLKRAALFLLRESKKIVPVDTGALRASGRVVDGYQSATGMPAPGALGALTGRINVHQEITVYVVYTVYYALYVHEAVHIPRKHGKLAKFVEIPLKANYALLMFIVEEEVKMELNLKAGKVTVGP